MRIKFNVAEYSITSEYAYISDPLNQSKQFPILTIGKDSYIEEAFADFVPDRHLVYNLQIGRYSSVAPDVTFIIDMNHDFRKVCQGRISGVDYCRPELTKRKGQIIIMNDCWIGEGATILSGVTIGNGAVVAANAVVTKDVPPFSIVAGNSAKIIGYRFEQNQIDALNLIRWWNWTPEKIMKNAPLLYGNVDKFIWTNIRDAQVELNNIAPANILPIEKKKIGDEKIFLYIPDFEQDYPTYPNVIKAFIEAYSDTNYELFLYIEEDSLLSEKIDLINEILEPYEDKDCYINLYIGKISDKRSLFSEVDVYVTNRSLDNVYHMDLADLFELQIISGVDLPIFSEFNIEYSIKNITDNKDVINEQINQAFGYISQLSTNQVAMNAAVNNLKYELFADETQLQYPIIASVDETIDLIINEGKSLCRFGDGEFELMAYNARQKFQRVDENLANRLKEVLHSDNDNILLGLMNIFGDLSRYNDECRYNIRAYLTEEVRKRNYELIDMKRTYYDAYVTRPYASYLDNKTDAPQKRFNRLKEIWNNRDILIIEGEKTRMGIGNDLFDNAKSIIRILGPAEHAFDKYDELLSEALKQDKSLLILIAMGPTATILAYDLANAGYQALDIGHVDIEYEWMKAGTGKKVPVKTKYNNEVENGNIVEDVCDPKYEKQIIARCV